MRTKMSVRSIGVLLLGLVIVVWLFVAGGCARNHSSVVVYTALDRNFSEPIFNTFTERTGIRVLAKYDTESTKTIGLVNTIIAEASRPRCDVFWNNEIVNTIRLKARGHLQPIDPMQSALFPPAQRDTDRTWYGFAGRARVVIINDSIVPSGVSISGVGDLLDPRLAGRIGIAKPLFGTTATHASALFVKQGNPWGEEFFTKLKANGVSIESGNRMCAARVANGGLVAALTDTDDAIEEIRAGKPVRIVFPDQGEGEMGTLLIPNTLSLIRGCPHPEEGKLLIDFLLSPEVEMMLAEGASAQIPLNVSYTNHHPLSPLPAKWMEVDYASAAESFDEVASWLTTHFLEP